MVTMTDLDQIMLNDGSIDAMLTMYDMLCDTMQACGMTLKNAPSSVQAIIVKADSYRLDACDDNAPWEVRLQAAGTAHQMYFDADDLICMRASRG